MPFYRIEYNEDKLLKTLSKGHQCRYSKDLVFYAPGNYEASIEAGSSVEYCDDFDDPSNIIVSWISGPVMNCFEVVELSASEIKPEWGICEGPNETKIIIQAVSTKLSWDVS